MEDQVEGRNSVLELLESGKDVNKIVNSIDDIDHLSKYILIWTGK